MLPWLCEFASRACRVVVMGCVLCARMFSEDWIFRWSCFILLHALVFQECVERGTGRWAQGGTMSHFFAVCAQRSAPSRSVPFFCAARSVAHLAPLAEQHLAANDFDAALFCARPILQRCISSSTSRSHRTPKDVGQRRSCCTWYPVLC